MGKIDLSKEVSFQDLKNINIKNAFKKKKVELPSKKGINLIPPKKSKKNGLLVIGVTLAAAVALLAVAFFGIYKPISAKNQAQAEYDAVHQTYTQTLEAVGDYDEILKEYHSYSLDWMKGGSGRNYVSVPRETILKMVDKTIKPAGALNSISVSGETMVVHMSNMTLTEVTQMLSKIEEEPFVSYAFLQQAISQEAVTVKTDENGQEVEVPGPETVVFTITVYLQKVAEEEAAQ